MRNDLKANFIDSREGFADTADIVFADGSIFKHSENIGMEYVKSVDVDRLLAPIFEMHGVPAPNNSKRYCGWERKSANNWSEDGGDESFTLAGHSLGHWMSAAAAFCRHTGDDELLEKLDYAVKCLDGLQNETGSSYIGGCPEDTFIKCFNGDRSWSDGYWVPWYGIHKIYQGLADAYRYTGNDTAFKVLKSFADWAVNGTAGLSDEFMQEMLDVEPGGMNEIFALMYEFTGNAVYLYTARRFTHDRILSPLINGEDRLAGLHANTQIPKIIGAAALYEQKPDTYSDYRTASENFWNIVVKTRSYAIGGNSIAEHFEECGLESLGIKTCESCNTYNMMRLTEHLFAWEHKSVYMDWYENALYNHILGQQEPETGAKMYFVSLLQGHHRVYEKKYESWWCCTGTGMENPGRYARCLFYEDNDDLYVNLYTANDYVWKNKSLSFRTETEYPYSDRVRITVTDGSAYANIKFRVPSWCAGMTVTVNGTVFTGNGGYITVSRVWSRGDEAELVIPMSIRIYKSRSGRQIAYKYGPLALAALLGDIRGGVEEYISNETRIDAVTADCPYIVTNGEAPENFAKLCDSERLIFTISPEHSSDGRPIRLEPFFGVHHKFYTVYFDLDAEYGYFEKALNDITIDRAEPDGQQDELGHGLRTNSYGDGCVGSFAASGKNYMYRRAFPQQDHSSDELPFVSYRMRTGSETNYVCVAVWSGDDAFSCDGVVYDCDFDVFADEVKIGEIKINDKSDKALYEFFAVPQNLTDGKENITVTLKAKNKNSCVYMLELRITSDILHE